MLAFGVVKVLKADAKADRDAQADSVQDFVFTAYLFALMAQEFVQFLVYHRRVAVTQLEVFPVVKKRGVEGTAEIISKAVAAAHRATQPIPGIKVEGHRAGLGP